MRTESYTAVRYWVACLGALALLLVLSPHAAAQETAPAPQPLPLPQYVTDGPVSALASAHGRVYLGGSFTRIGPHTGGFAAVTQADGARVARLPSVGGAVYAVVSDGNGGYYIGGAFGSVGGVPRANLAHVLADGSVDPAFNPAPDNIVLGLAIVGDRLFLGGDFVHVGTDIRRRLAAVYLPSGALDPAFSPGVDGPVADIVPVGDKLLVDGAFRGIGGKSRRGFAAIDQTTGDLVAGFDVTPDGQVNAIHRMGDRVYLGGNFTTINGRSRSRLAAIDAASGELDGDFAPSSNGAVLTITDDGERLFVGGQFTEIAQTFDNGVASLHPVTGRASADFRFFAQGAVGTVAVVGGELFVGGNYVSINDQPVPRLAAVNKVTGAVRGGFAPDPNGDVYALLASGDELVVAGTYTSVPRRAAGNIAALDAATGVHDPSFSAAVGGPVSTLVVDGTSVFVGGAFGAVNGVGRGNVAEVDAFTGALRPLNVPVEGTVQALAAGDGALYVGGFFVSPDHPGLLRIAGGKVDARFNRYRPRQRRVAPIVPLLRRGATVSSLLLTGERLYVGGAFATPTFGRATTLVAIDTARRRVVRPFNPLVEGTPDELLLGLDGSLYVTGGYVQRRIGTRIERTPDGGRRRVPIYRSGLFALRTTDGTVRRPFNPALAGAGAALATDGWNVYVGGGFAQLNGRRIDNLGAVGVGTGGLVESYTPQPLSGQPNFPFPFPGAPVFGQPVSALVVAGERLYVGGGFSSVGFFPQAYLASFPLAGFTGL